MAAVLIVTLIGIAVGYVLGRAGAIADEIDRRDKGHE